MATGTVWPFLRRMAAGNFGVFPVATSAKLGTAGGTTVADTSTTTLYVAVPRRTCKLIGVSVSGPTAAVSASGTVKVQVFKRTSSAASPADVAQTASTSIEADIITAANSYDWPVTATDINSVFNVTTTGGDLCRIDIVATNTVGTQPILDVTCQWNIIN